MNRYDFYKSRYDIEISKITEFNNSLNVPLAIIVAIGAAIYSFLLNFKFTEFNFNTWAFLILIYLSFSFLLISGFYLINVFAFSYRSDYNYRYIEFTDELEEYHMNLQNYYQLAADNNSEIEFENFIINRYVLYCSANERINRVKSKYLNLGKEFLIGSLFFLIGSFFPFMVNHFYHL